jgi:UPF0176 protein
MFQIITFYEFCSFASEDLPQLRESLRRLMTQHSVKGTIILAEEGFNASVSANPADMERFVPAAEQVLGAKLNYKSSFHEGVPFRKIDVKIKPEIVTLKRRVDISKGKGTHVSPAKWNEIISDPDVVVLDTRNDYEFKNGTFLRAINPGTEKFSELPEYVEANLDPNLHPKVAMFCTGGIRCEKFAPYLKERGFEVFQLEGGILKYLEETRGEDSLWEGECFVFDDRRTINEELRKGVGPDYSQKGSADVQGGGQ